MNNVSYHRHGDRRSNQMKSKTEMAEQLCGIVASGNFGALAQCAMPARTRRPHPLRPHSPLRCRPGALANPPLPPCHPPAVPAAAWGACVAPRTPGCLLTFLLLARTDETAVEESPASRRPSISPASARPAPRRHDEVEEEEEEEEDEGREPRYSPRPTRSRMPRGVAQPLPQPKVEYQEPAPQPRPQPQMLQPHPLHHPQLHLRPPQQLQPPPSRELPSQQPQAQAVTQTTAVPADLLILLHDIAAKSGSHLRETPSSPQPPLPPTTTHPPLHITRASCKPFLGLRKRISPFFCARLS